MVYFTIFNYNYLLKTILFFDNFCVKNFFYFNLDFCFKFIFNHKNNNNAAFNRALCYLTYNYNFSFTVEDIKIEVIKIHNKKV